jgi:hypothetical protein
MSKPMDAGEEAHGLDDTLELARPAGMDGETTQAAPRDDAADIAGAATDDPVNAAAAHSDGNEQTAGSKKAKPALDALAASIAAQEEALVEQAERHRRAQQNARKSHAARKRALKTEVGSLAVSHNLVDLTSFELEGAFVDLAMRMSDPAERARWSELGQKAASQREADRRPDEIFYIGLDGAVSAAYRKAIQGHGCKFSTRSARFATLKMKMLPEPLMELAKHHGQAIWTLDETLEKVFVYRPGQDDAAIRDTGKGDGKTTFGLGRRMGVAPPRSG